MIIAVATPSHFVQPESASVVSAGAALSADREGFMRRQHKIAVFAVLVTFVVCAVQGYRCSVLCCVGPVSWWNGLSETDQAAWISAVGTVAAAFVALGLYIHEHYFVRPENNRIRARDQATLAESLVKDMEEHCAAINVHINSLANGKTVTRAAFDNMFVSQIDPLAAMLNEIGAFQEPLRGQLLRLIALARTWNFNLEKNRVDSGSGLVSISANAYHRLPGDAKVLFMLASIVKREFQALAASVGR